jgi:phospholipase C
MKRRSTNQLPLRRRFGCVCALLAALAGADMPARVSANTSYQSRTPIRHFIVMMESKRSFDSFFGKYARAEGIPLSACVVLAHNECAKPYEVDDNGVVLLDQPDQATSGFFTLAYYTDKHIPYFWNVADRYVLFDRYFSSTRANTNAANWNRMFSIAAVSGGGSRIPAEGYTDITTIFDRLNEKGVSWKFYIEDYVASKTYRAIEKDKPVPSQLVRAPLLNIPRFIDDAALSKNIVDLNAFYDDLNRGELPSVSYIVSKGAGEPSHKSLIIAQRNLKKVFQALLRSSAWSSSALLWTHDQADGWYDHVKPPKIGKSELGSRVPAMLISPYAPSGKIDSTQLEHASILKFIEYNWDVTPLQDRDDGASNFVSVFDFAQPPRSAELIAWARVPSTIAQQKGPNRMWIFVLYGGALMVMMLGVGFAFYRFRTQGQFDFFM